MSVRMLLLASALLACALWASACFILSGDIACNVDDDCPADVGFCVDRGAERICSDAGDRVCVTNAECDVALPSCTQDPEGQRFCTSFCDAENTCINEVGEFCFLDACTVDVGCDSDDDCSGAFAICLIDPELPLSCAAGDRSNTCDAVEHPDCVAFGQLCETSHYGFCMDAQSAVGACDAASALPLGFDMVIFIESAEVPGDCANAGQCLDIIAIVFDPIGAPIIDAGEFATNEAINSAVQDVDGNVNASSNTIVNPSATAGADRSVLTFRVETDRAPAIVSISIGSVAFDDGGPGISNAACFAP